MGNARRVSAATAVAALVFLGVLLLSGSADAKKKHKKGGGVVTVTKSVGLTIPDRPPGGTSGSVSSSIPISEKRFKGKTVGDVNLTFETTGSEPGAATDILVRLTAPSGASRVLWYGVTGQSIGPLTLDDDTPLQICSSNTPPCKDPDLTVNPPYVGTAEPIVDPLVVFDRSPIRGTWTLTVLDTGVGKINKLDLWGLTITAARPVKG